MKRTYGITRAASGIAVLAPLIGSPRARRHQRRNVKGENRVQNVYCAVHTPGGD